MSHSSPSSSLSLSARASPIRLCARCLKSLEVLVVSAEEDVESSSSALESGSLSLSSASAM